MRDPSKAAPLRTQRFAMGVMYLLMAVAFGVLGGLNLAGGVFGLLAVAWFVYAWRTNRSETKPHA